MGRRAKPSPILDMSEISDAIQDKCLAFSDRIIKLNDYLLERASQKYDAGRQKYGMRKGKSSFSHQTSDFSQTSYFSHQPSLRLYHHRDLIGSLSSCK